MSFLLSEFYDSGESVDMDAAKKGSFDASVKNEKWKRELMCIQILPLFFGIWNNTVPGPFGIQIQCNSKASSSPKLEWWFLLWASSLASISALLCLNSRSLGFCYTASIENKVCVFTDQTQQKTSKLSKTLSLLVTGRLVSVSAINVILRLYKTFYVSKTFRTFIYASVLRKEARGKWHFFYSVLLSCVS